MKKLKSFGSLVVISWCLILAPVVITPIGCRSANQSAYRVAGTAQVSADAAMRAWGNYVAQFHPSLESEQRVKSAFERYRLAMMVVAGAGKALAEADNQDTRQKLDIALAAAANSLSELTNLIQSFNVKIQ